MPITISADDVFGRRANREFQARKKLEELQDYLVRERERKKLAAQNEALLKTPSVALEPPDLIDSISRAVTTGGGRGPLTQEELGALIVNANRPEQQGVGLRQPVTTQPSQLSVAPPAAVLNEKGLGEFLESATAEPPIAVERNNRQRPQTLMDFIPGLSEAQARSLPPAAQKSILEKRLAPEKPQSSEHMYQDEKGRYRFGLFDERGNLVKDLRSATKKEIEGSAGKGDKLTDTDYRAYLSKGYQISLQKMKWKRPDQIAILAAILKNPEQADTLTSQLYQTMTPEEEAKYKALVKGWMLENVPEDLIPDVEERFSRETFDPDAAPATVGQSAMESATDIVNRGKAPAKRGDLVKLPPTIQKQSEAISHLRSQYGMSDQEARAWLRKNTVKK